MVSMDENFALPDFRQVRIENTNRCFYHCRMCPREQMTRSLGTMSLADLGLVLARVEKAPPEVHLHGFGEPLLDSDLPEKIDLVRRVWPQTVTAFFTTLGVRFKDDYLRRLVDSGLHGLRISCYGFSSETYLKMHGVDRFRLVLDNLQEFITLWLERGRPFALEMITTRPGQWYGLSVAEKELRESLLSWLRGSGVEVQETFSPHNYGGGRQYREIPDKGLCSVVWGRRKHILQVSWDLEVVPCCFDFNSTVSFGNLRSNSLAEIFTGQKYCDFIEAHKKNDLSSYKVCLGCERCFSPVPS